MDHEQVKRDTIARVILAEAGPLWEERYRIVAPYLGDPTIMSTWTEALIDACAGRNIRAMSAWHTIYGVIAAHQAQRDVNAGRLPS